MIKSIENEYLKVSFNTKGAELISIYDKTNKKEMMYQPLRRSWGSSDVCIFPFVARIKDGYFTHEGVTYEMEKHGIVRSEELTISSLLDDEATLVFKYNIDTLNVYPFKFTYYVNFKLIDNSIKVSYIVKNEDDKTIYYGIGGHPAFMLDGYFDGEFNYNKATISIETESVNKVKLDEYGFFMLDITNEEFPREFEVTKQLFRKEKTLILETNGVKVHLRQEGRSIDLESDCRFIAFWSDEVSGNYVCVEPWWSLPDFENCNKEISQKNTINSLEKGNMKEYSYTITINK